MKNSSDALDVLLELDEVDRAIIAQLTQDGRMPVATLAARVHLSRAHCYSRLARLEEAGILTGYSVQVDPVKLGLGAAAHVSLKLRQHDWRRLRARLLDIPEVWHISLVSGHMDVILLVRAKDTADLRRVVFQQIQPLEGVVDTQTHVIFEDIASDYALTQSLNQ